jgi:hypothetical protein
MAKKCKTCANDGVYGIEDAKYIEVASAVVGAFVSGKVDEMIVNDADGVPKDNYFSNNPTVKNAAFVVAGVALTAFMPGEMALGAGIGMATYGGYNLITELMNKDATVSGLTYRRSGNIASIENRMQKDALGLRPANIAYQGSNNKRDEFIARMRERETNQNQNRVKIPTPDVQEVYAESILEGIAL